MENYEERYKEALERARTSFSYPDYPGFMRVDVIFPELKENESEDEKIRLEIRNFIWGYPDKLPERDKWLAWFKKQGEKKPTDKIEPRFRPGDWITDGYLTCKVLSVTGKFYELHLYNDDYCHFETDVQSVDKRYHLWTIQEAKDGDVLVDEDNNIGIYVGKKDDFWHSCIYLGCDSCLRKIGGYHKCNNTKPATKEQRYLLFQKIKEAGYKWDADKKELKKIGPKKLDANKVINWVNPDKVIEWLKGTIRETKEYFGEHGEYYDSHLTLSYDSIEDLINDFKEDFGL